MVCFYVLKISGFDKPKKSNREFVFVGDPNTNSLPPYSPKNWSPSLAKFGIFSFNEQNPIAPAKYNS